jgi:acetaldehyde dehydrogenase (acetylating)
MAADPPFDSGTPERDLASIAEARTLARWASQAQLQLREFSQERIDLIVDAMAAAVLPRAQELARLAIEETGYGVFEDKVRKNLFAAERVHQFIRPMKTVGVIGRQEDRGIVEIAEPFGVAAGIIPVTNPTSTTIYKILIAIKARCAIVLSPHPAAAGCAGRTAELMAAAAQGAGAPDGCIACMKTVTVEGTEALMRRPEVAVILATGGRGLVRAAYSAGKPAYGVGPGNAPAYIERSADIGKAVGDIIAGKTFDNGLLCSSENSVVVDRAIAEEVRREFVVRGGYFLSPEEAAQLSRALILPELLPNPAMVGKSAVVVAEKAGLAVPPQTRVLLAELDGVGRDHPLSIEKLCPVLSFYVVKDSQEACGRCAEILRFGGIGHTMSIHSRDEEVVLGFGLRQPAFRIVVNSPSSLGSVGLTTGLDPALTLGCGGLGGNITSENLSPRHLINLKHLAYETRPAQKPQVAAPTTSAAGVRSAQSGQGLACPSPAPGDAPVSRRIDAFLASRGIHPPRTGGTGPPAPAREPQATESPAVAASAAPRGDQIPSPAEFVCEEDVRRALRAGTTILVGERTIVTPSARDLGTEKGVLVRGPERS